MKNCVGQAVRGDDFWKRDNELAAIWSAIDSGSHILLAAPRRVGKTSIMFHLQDKPMDGYAVVYLDIESADSENEFWHKLFNALTEEEFVSRLKTYSKAAFDKLKSIRIKKISTSGVEFGDSEALNYCAIFEEFVKELDSDRKIVIMIDEFAQTVENIIKYESPRSAEGFLNANRALRQNPKISSKVIFVYAGSIGLESVVSKIGATKLINDLNSIKVSPLTQSEALKFTNKLCADIALEIKEDATAYLLEKIEWLIPFYIQLIAQELKTISRQPDKAAIEKSDVDTAIGKAIEHKNHFDHWQSKLKEGFDKKQYLFAKEILNIASENSTISSSEISNLAAKYDLDQDDAKDVIHSLVYDGYINNNDNSKIYRFNSPILKAWWNKYVAN